MRAAAAGVGMALLFFGAVFGGTHLGFKAIKK